MPRPRGLQTKWSAIAVAALVIALVLVVRTPSSTGSRVLTPPSGYRASELLFDDTASGSSIDTSRWVTFLNAGGAGDSVWNSNGKGGSSPANPSPDYDAEYDLPRQVSEANGFIDIRTTRTPTAGILDESAAVYPFASGAISTFGKFEFTGGYVQIEAKMPAGAGLWPGLWMLPGRGAANASNYEIDIFEGGYNAPPGLSPDDVFAWHLHTPAGTVGADTISKVNLTTGFHIYGLKWVPSRSITWYLDGKIIGSVTSAQATIPDEPMELIINMQVATSAASGFHSAYNSATPRVSNMLISGVQVYS